MSTVTAIKNRLKRNGIIKKAYLPVHHRVGYPLVSFSQLRAQRPPEALLKALSKYQGLQINEANRSIISYQATDPFNTFVMAHHRDYSSFKEFERVLSLAEKWSHELLKIN